MSPLWSVGRRFEGRVALVTGAGGTLGGAIARGLGREGAQVAVGYRSSRTAAESTALDITEAGGDVMLCHLDVTTPSTVDECLRSIVHRCGQVDVFVNAAGRLESVDTVPLDTLDLADAAALLDVEVIGTLRMCQAVLPALPDRTGAILNLSSTYGNGVNPDNPINFVPVAYCAAKGAIRGLTVAMARELASGIRVNAGARTDLGPMGAGVGRLWPPDRRGDRNDPLTAVRAPRRDRRDRARPSLRRRRLHHRTGRACGRRLAGPRLTMSRSKEPTPVHRHLDQVGHCFFGGTAYEH